MHMPSVPQGVPDYTWSDGRWGVSVACPHYYLPPRFFMGASRRSKPKSQDVVESVTCRARNPEF